MSDNPLYSHENLLVKENKIGKGFTFSWEYTGKKNKISDDPCSRENSSVKENKISDQPLCSP